MRRQPVTGVPLCMVSLATTLLPGRTAAAVGGFEAAAAHGCMECHWRNSLYRGLQCCSMCMYVHPQ